MPGASPFIRRPSRVWPPRPVKPTILLPARVGVGSGVTLRLAGVLVRPMEPAACGTREAVTQKATTRWSPTDGDATLWGGGNKEVCRHETGWGQGIYLRCEWVPQRPRRSAPSPLVVRISIPSRQSPRGASFPGAQTEPPQPDARPRPRRLSPVDPNVTPVPPGCTGWCDPSPKPDETQGRSTREAGCPDLRASHGASRRGGEQSRGCTTLLTATVSLRLC